MVGWLASLGSFFRLRWKAMLVIVVGLLLVFVIWKWRSDIEDKMRAVIGQQQLMQVIEEQNQSIKELKQEQQRVKRLNKKYIKQLEEIENQMEGISHDVQKLEEQNEKVADWADNSMPDAVYSRLRQANPDNSNQDKNGANSASKGVDSADSSPKTSGQKE